MVIVPLNDWTILCAMEVEVRVMKNKAIPMIIYMVQVDESIW
jgi:hypothetical protein